MTNYAWFDFRTNAPCLMHTYPMKDMSNVCRIFEIEGVSNHSIYPDWQHDKNLGTDKVGLPLFS